MNILPLCCCGGSSCGEAADLIVSQMQNFPGTQYYFPAEYNMTARKPGGAPILAQGSSGLVVAFQSNITGNIGWNNSSVLTNLNETPYFPNTYAWDKYGMAPPYPQDDCKWVFWVDTPPLFRNEPAVPMGYKISQIQAYPGVTGQCLAFNAITTQHLGFDSKIPNSSCEKPNSLCTGACKNPCVVMILRVRITGQWNRTTGAGGAGGCICTGPGSVCGGGIGGFVDYKHCCSNDPCNCCLNTPSCTGIFQFCKLPDKFITDSYYRSYWNGTDSLQTWLTRPFNLYRISSNFTSDPCGATTDVPTCRTYLLPGANLEYDSCKTMPGGDSFTQADIDNMPCDWEDIPLTITPVYNPLIPDVSSVKSLDPCGAVVNGTGTLVGGTLMTITGDNFLYASGVTVNGIACTGIQFVNNTQVKALTPASLTPGAKFVRVTTPGGTSVPSPGDVFTYTNNAGPAICIVSPLGGLTGGGTFLTLTGANFTGATAVTIGGILCTALTVLNSGTITCVSPAAVPPGFIGGRSIQVFTPFGTSSGFTQWFYN